VLKTLKSSYTVCNSSSALGLDSGRVPLSGVVEGSRISNFGGYCRAAGS
jgi:hypothetical protein